MTRTLTLAQHKTYTWSAAFIAANIALPHLFHLIPGGGVMFLPIYFFTIIGAMRYGVQLGLLTAVMTPIVGNLIFGAPASAMIPDMLFKGAMLAVVGAAVARRFGTSLTSCAFALVGLIEWPVMGATYAFQDFVTGLPGMAMMTLGAFLTSKLIK